MTLMLSVSTPLEVSSAGVGKVIREMGESAQV